jgi:uncharacterized protein
MILADVNVLVYAHRADLPDHQRYRAWLEEVLAGQAAYGLSELVLSGFLRLVTNPRVFKEPTPLEAALEFAEQVRTPAHALTISPGPRHWGLFVDLCRRASARGKLIPDAYFAALAIESGSEWITTDRDYARFPGLRWRHPLE